jgi:dipeptidyl aminopeptidase/acylaminoacyl peptidase
MRDTRPTRSKIPLVALVALLASVSGAPSVVAQDRMPALIPIEDLFGNPKISSAQISPSGEWLAYLKPYREKLNIHLRRIGSEVEHRITSDTTRPITEYSWSVDSRRILYVQDQDGNEDYHVHAVALDELRGPGEVPEAVNLTPYEGSRAMIFALPHTTPDRILIGLNLRSASTFDAYWLDLNSGDLRLVAENPGRHGVYYADHTGQVRAAVAMNHQGGTEILGRDSEQDEWRVVAVYPVDELVMPLRFHPDNRRFYLTSNHGEADLTRLVLLDLETGDEEFVEGDPEGRVDFGEAIFSEITGDLIATSYQDDTVRVYGRTALARRDVRALRSLHGGVATWSSMTLDGRRAIVSYDDPTDPRATYLYDREAGSGKFLFRPRPWLRPAQLAYMRPISFRSRDGLTIHGYLTTPRDVSPLNLPLVVLVHGGPWMRDNWGWNPEVQLLANRGYAVLQVNYRGSLGYGKHFLNAAVREWAGAMHDDLVDGVRWAVEQRIADPDRVGIFGTSYGGYAALVGLTFTPQVFACGVDYAGPSSLLTLLESFPPYWRPFLEGTFYRHVGDPAKPDDREELRRRSPLFYVDQIDDPLLIIHGANDPRVKKREADQLAIALRDKSVEVQYLLADDEGHGFAKVENRLAAYRAIEQFFGECLGGRVQPQAEARLERHLAELEVDVDTLSIADVSDRHALYVGDPLIDPDRIREEGFSGKLVFVQGERRREVGTVRESVSFTQVDGRAVIRRVQEIESQMVGTSSDTILVDRSALEPVSIRSHNQFRTVSVEFDGPRVTGWHEPTGADPEPVDLTLQVVPFPWQLSGLVMRAVPLSEGLAVSMPTYVYDDGRVIEATAVVRGVEDLELADGHPVSAWAIDVDLAGQKLTWWLTEEDRAPILTEVKPIPGVTLRLEFFEE